MAKKTSNKINIKFGTIPVPHIRTWTVVSLVVLVIVSGIFTWLKVSVPRQAKASPSLTITSPTNNSTAPAGQILNLSATLSGVGGQTSPSSAPLGIGLNGVNDWSTQYPFLNQMKMARNWSYGCGWGNNCTKTIDDVQFDSNGYPTFIPESDKGGNVSTIFQTILAPYSQNRYKTRYAVLYEGEGTLSFFQATVDQAASTPGRTIIDLNPGSETGETNYAIRISNTDPNRTGNYIRNIRIVPVEFESLLNQGEIFNPEFLAKIEKFASYRFMDWLSTNNSVLQDWSDRLTPTDFSYAVGKKNGKEVSGVPLEIVIALGNKMNKDIWVNTPHLATDDYLINFGNLIKNNLNPNLKAYIEYSNETWNWQFTQAQYANTQGRQRWAVNGDPAKAPGDSWVQYNGMRQAQLCDLWKKQIFVGQTHRVKCVMASQTGWRGLEDSVFECSLWVAEGNAPCYQHGIDIMAISFYFSGGLNDEQNYPVKKMWMDDPNPNTRFAPAIQQIRTNNLGWGDAVPNTLDTLRYYKAYADARGLTIAGYEGGSHITGNGHRFQDDPQNIQYDIALNEHPEMQQIYSELLNGWKDNGGGIFYQFVDVGVPSKYGSWGALRSITSTTSPKWEALMAYAQANNGLASTNTTATKVEYFVTPYGTTGQTPIKVGEDTNPSDGFTGTWPNPVAGDYNLFAVATLSDNTTVTSPNLRVTITPNTPNTPNLSLNDLPNLLTLTNLSCTDTIPGGSATCTGRLPNNMLPPTGSQPGNPTGDVLYLKVQGATTGGVCTFSAYVVGATFNCTIPVSPVTGSNLPIQAGFTNSSTSQSNYVNSGATINVVENNPVISANVPIYLIDRNNITFSPTKNQPREYCGSLGASNPRCGDLTIGVQGDTRILEGARCEFSARPYPTPNSPSSPFSTAILSNNGVATYTNGSCSVTLTKANQTVPKWEFNLVVTNPNVTNVAYGAQPAYFMLFGAVGVTNITVT